MELRVLRYFLAVANEGNISRAANVLHLTQPTLSRQIAELEQSLGTRLLVRRSHSVALTREGMLLRQRAEELVGLADKVESEFLALDKTVAGDVHIGAGESVHMRTIAATIRHVRQMHPGIHFNIFSSGKEVVAEQLERGLLDFGVMFGAEDLGRYHTLPLPGKDVWGLLSPEGGPLDGKGTVCREDLQSLPLVMPRRLLQRAAAGSPLVQWYGDDFSKLDIVATYNLMYNAALMVEAGVGHVIGLDKLANAQGSGKLCFRPLCPALEAGLAVVWRKDRPFSNAAAVFLGELKKMVAGGVQQGLGHR